MIVTACDRWLVEVSVPVVRPILPCLRACARVRVRMCVYRIKAIVFGGRLRSADRRVVGKGVLLAGAD